MTGAGRRLEKYKDYYYIFPWCVYLLVDSFSPLEMKRTRGDIQRYMIAPANRDGNYLPLLIWEILEKPIMAACISVDYKTLLAFVLSCRRLYYKTNWHQYVTCLSRERRFWKPENFAPFAPYVVEFHYRLPCHHGWELVNLAACPRLKTLVLYGNECGSYGWEVADGVLPSSLQHLVCHNWHRNQMAPNAFLNIPFGQLEIAECSGSQRWREDVAMAWDEMRYVGFTHRRCRCFEDTFGESDDEHE